MMPNANASCRGWKYPSRAVRSRLRDRVSKGARSQQRDDGPAVEIQRAANRRHSRRKQDERGDVQAKEERRQMCGRAPRNRGDGLVHERQVCLGVQDRPVARKELRIELPHHRRTVERQIGGAIPVAGGVGRGENHEWDQSQEPAKVPCALGPSPRLRASRYGGQAGPSRSAGQPSPEPRDYPPYCSSAVGP